MALTEMQQKWVEALRSGKYKQCKFALKDEDGFCCLGVACDVFGVTPSNDERRLDDSDNTQAVQSMLGLVAGAGEYGGEKGTILSLAQLNDGSTEEGRTYSFVEIADIIESEPDGLFVKEEK